MSRPIFGYGSLISPVNIVSKIQAPETLSEAYTTDGQPYITEAERAAWEQFDGGIDLLPAKIAGFRRFYSKKSIRGGAVLEAVQTGNPADQINGMVIEGLTPDQYSAISATEPGYETVTLDPDQIAFYDRSHRDTYSGTPAEVFVNVADPADLSVTVPRNEVYHNRILDGIRMLSHSDTDRTVAEFRADFEQTTVALGSFADD